MIDTAKVNEHYGQESLVERLRSMLEQAGLEGIRVTPSQLASLDQFHSRGLAATIDMGKLLSPLPSARVLDIGSGLGGPSRYLADTFGCQVSGIDLSPYYVEAAGFLAQCCGLSSDVDYQCADALALPFEDGSFDLVWTQHVAMNISDRARLYAEAYRVLRPSGRLAIYDVLEGNGEPLHFPVPWSRTPDTSFLMTWTAMKASLEQLGFQMNYWADRTDAGIQWFAEVQKQQERASAKPQLGLHLAMGPEFKVMAANLGRNLKENRAVLVETIFKRN